MISSGLEVDWASEGIDTSRSVKTNSGRIGAFYCVEIFAAAKNDPPKPTLTAKLSGTPVSDVKTVAKMGHPVVLIRSDVGHPTYRPTLLNIYFANIWASCCTIFRSSRFF
jgi:hypothetical protein